MREAVTESENLTVNKIVNAFVIFLVSLNYDKLTCAYNKLMEV